MTGCGEFRNLVVTAEKTKAELLARVEELMNVPTSDLIPSSVQRDIVLVAQR